MRAEKWNTPPYHPDIDLTSEATLVRDILAEAHDDTTAIDGQGWDTFRAASTRAAEAFLDAITKKSLTERDLRFADWHNSCVACHTRFRD